MDQVDMHGVPCISIVVGLTVVRRRRKGEVNLAWNILIVHIIVTLHYPHNHPCFLTAVLIVILDFAACEFDLPTQVRAQVRLQ